MLTDGVSRQQLRLMAINALIAAKTMVGSRVFGWADWPTSPDLFPLLLVSTPRERRVSIYPGQLDFTTTISVVVVGRLVGPMPAPVGEGLENLAEQITNALCLDPTLIRAVQQYNVIETQTIVTADGRQHIGEISMTFEMIVFQQYGPIGVPLTDILSTATIVGAGPSITFDIAPLQST